MAQIKSLPAAHRLAEILIAGLMLALAAAMIAGAPGAVGEAAFRLAAAALLIALALGIAVLAVRRAKPDGGETGSRRQRVRGMRRRRVAWADRGRDAAQPNPQSF